MASNWTDERVEKLKALWADGLSAAAIAARLGDISRAGVLGKVDRLVRSGLMPERGWNVHRRAPPASLERPVSAPKPTAPVAVESEPLQLTIMEISDKTCRWPIGDVGPDLRFCGCAPKQGSPYCHDHARKAHQPHQSHRTTVAAK